MDLRKIATSEHFSAKRKVVSGFGVGVVASLLVFTLLFINNPFKISFSEATSGSSSPFPWFFPQPKSVISASSSSVSVDIWGEDEGSMGAKVHEGNLGNVDKNTGLLSSGVGENNIEKTHEGNFSENFENGSFLGGEETVKGTTHVGNLSETSKNESFLKFGIVDRGVEKTHLGNLSENLGEGSPLSREEMVIGKTHEGNSLENNKNVSSLNSEEAERIREQTREGNFSNNLKNGSWFSTEERINETVHEKKSPEEAKNSSIPNEGLRITEKTRESNVSKSDNNSSAVKKPHEGAQGKEKNSTSYNGSPSMEGIKGVSGKCNIFNGRWVRDEGKPYYPAGSCPHIEKDFDCHGNGRPDDDFLKWRWQPNDCNIPSLNATDFLDRLRGKRLLFVGDSLNRNMWESLVCILRHSIVHKSKVHEISEGRKFKTKGYYSFRYEDYNCSIDFIRSPFLVRPSSIRGKKGQEETLRLDLMDETTRAYREADVLVFNTGHWWTHAKTSKGKDYYQEGNYVHPMLNAIEAYEKALTTWARWIDKHVDARKTRVFFRGYSLTHFRGGQWNSGGQCHNETEPIFNESYLGSYPSKMRALEHVLESMKTPVVYLNISRLTDYRKDAHPSIYRKEYKTDQQSQDCSHWCLPGVPDTWNELLYASLVMDT